jgi:putative flippase GtrA
MHSADRGGPGTKEKTMSALNNTLKSLACGVGALAITAVLSWTFVQSTATVPGVSAATSVQTATRVAKLTIQQRHVWFGQSQPAVLVD